MTTAEKVAQVTRVVGEFVLQPALAAIGLPRSTWFYQQRRTSYEERHGALRSLMLKVASQSPEYGYRRMATELSERSDRPVNTKVVRRLAQSLGLTHLRKPRGPRKSAIRRTLDDLGKRANLVADLEEIDLYQVLYTDFTEVVYGAGKAWLIPLLDHDSKDVVGWAMGPSANRELALLAWSRARRRLRTLGVNLREVIVHHDRDAVFTSEQWVRRLVIEDGVRLSYALRGARDNPEVESWNGRFKQENADLFREAATLQELEAVVGARMKYYTERRRHSTLGNVAPRSYVRGRLKKKSSQ